MTLRWLLQQGIIIIPRTSKVERAKQNFAVFDFELSADDMKALSGLYAPRRPSRQPGLGAGVGQLRCRLSKRRAPASRSSVSGPGNCAGADCARLTQEALRLGCRHLDTAQAYENEAEVGEGLKAFGIGRDEVFVTTKITPPNYAPADFERSTRRACRSSSSTMSTFCCCIGRRLPGTRWPTCSALSPR